MIEKICAGYLFACLAVCWGVAILHVLRFPGKTRVSSRVIYALISPISLVAAILYFPEAVARIIADTWQDRVKREEAQRMSHE